jgi:hypothetical protein
MERRVKVKRRKETMMKAVTGWRNPKKKKKKKKSTAIDPEVEGGTLSSESVG